MNEFDHDQLKEHNLYENASLIHKVLIRLSNYLPQVNSIGGLIFYILTAYLITTLVRFIAIQCGYKPKDETENEELRKIIEKRKQRDTEARELLNKINSFN